MRLRETLLLAVAATILVAAVADTSEAAPHRKRAVAGKRHKVAKRHKRRVFIEKHVVAIKHGQPNVQALGALVIELDTNAEVFLRKPDQVRPIASISKLAAVLVVMDHNLDLDDLTVIKKVDAEVARGGARSRLLEGMTLSNRDLLHAALMGSDNRAVSALGRAVGLSASPFAAAMTKKAMSLGLSHTRFREPTGLSPDNVSTPRETVGLLRAAMKHPVLAPIVRRVEYDAHPVSRPPIKYVSTHRSAGRSNTEILGGKTGYNDHARYCLVVAARVNGHSYGMAFLGGEGKLTRFGDVARVADWLMLHKAKKNPAGGSGQAVPPMQVGVPDTAPVPSPTVFPPPPPDAAPAEVPPNR